MKNSIKINNKYIGDNNPVYLIADLGLTNGGDIERTFKLIDISSKLKVDAVKFQLIGPEHLLGDKKISYTFPTLSKGRIKQNMFKMFKELEYSNEQWYKISNYAKSKKLEFICTSHFEGAVDILEKCKVNIHKTHSKTPLTKQAISRKLKK